LYSYCDVDCGKLFEIIKVFAGAMVITYHRSIIVQRLADAAKLERHTVTVQTGHMRSKRELIMYKAPSTARTTSGRRSRIRTQ
jgi:hypothetical protein